MSKLSIIIPAYNEEKYIQTLLQKVIDLVPVNNLEKEVIIINDSSKDKTWEIIQDFKSKYNYIIALNNEVNLGKSQTVKKGILASTGDFVIIQDSDLEYEPLEINDLLTKLFEGNYDVVYGNRFGKKNRVIYWQNYVGNIALSAFSNLFTFFRIKTWVPDMEVCYKLMKGDIIRSIAATIESKSTFGLEPEITAKLSRYKIDNRNLKFGIVPISYFPRSFAQGKKMNGVRDGIKALKEIIYFNTK
jgi:glycosyltransferase involved in cell wall biosynthesis